MALKMVFRFIASMVLTVGLIVVTSILQVAAAQKVEPDTASLVAQIDLPSLPSTPPQRFRTSEAWQQVYELLPELPLENQYVSRETGKVAVNNTLASRLIRYHTFVKGRPPNYRFDWKLTMADYLGANERMIPTSYPGADTLRVSPMQSDVAIISGMNRAQRDHLVQVLVTVFTSPTEAGNPTPTPSPMPAFPPTNQPQSPPASTPAPPIVQPRPGAAELLLP